MARYKNGINGTFSGKVGSVVGASCRGIDYMRSLPEVRTKAPSQKQIVQRFRFGLVTGWLRPILRIINIGFQILTGDKTAMNRAVSYHMREALTGEGMDTRIDFKKAVFSRGELLVSWILEVLCLIDAVLNIKWDNGPESAFNKPDDSASFIFYSEEKEQFITFENIALRQDKEAVLQMPAKFAGDKLHGWMQYASAEGGMVSTSVYLGEIGVV